MIGVADGDPPAGAFHRGSKRDELLEGRVQRPRRAVRALDVGRQARKGTRGRTVHRSRQQIKLTPAGELFREHARQVIHSAHVAKDALSDFRGALSGTVELGCLVSFGPLDIPKVLGDFHRRYPFVRIRLRHSPTGSSTYLSAIADGTLSLALVSAPDRFPPRIDMRLLAQEPMMLVCGPDHRLADRTYVSIRDLAGEDIIGFPPEGVLRRLIDDAL